MKLHDGCDGSPFVGVVAVGELVGDVLAALPEGFVSGKALDECVQVGLSHASVQPELAPSGAVERQGAADVLAIECHRQLRAEDQEIGLRAMGRRSRPASTEPLVQSPEPAR